MIPFPSDWTTNLIIAAVSLAIFTYYKIKKFHRYFEDRNIPYIKTKFLIGSDPAGVLMKVHQVESWDTIYRKSENNNVIGFFQGFVPYILIRDSECIHDVLTNNFTHFYDRSFAVNEEVNPLDAHLFFLKGNKWRFLRNKLSPIFSSVKLKWMYEEIVKCGNIFLKQIDEMADGKDVDLREPFTRYTTDVIASCAFGLDSESLTNENSEFRKYGREAFDPNKQNMVFFVLQFSIPDIFTSLKLRTKSEKMSNFFREITKKVLDHRKKTGLVRKDFMQLLLQLKENGNVELDSNFENGETKLLSSENFEITDELLAAQSFVFFLAGFETTATTLYLLTYLLSKHQDIQEKARKEVLDMKAKHGSFTYESIKEMTYLENCISETLRMYPVLPTLNRECTKDYTLSDGTFIERGTKIIIPIYSVQRDQKYFPDPLKFMPERFETAPKHGTYAPFGDGPRICIGKRFALVNVKYTVAKLLEKYRLELSPNNEHGDVLKLKPRLILIEPTTKIFLRIHKLHADN